MTTGKPWSTDLFHIGDPIPSTASRIGSMTRYGLRSFATLRRRSARRRLGGLGLGLRRRIGLHASPSTIGRLRLGHAGDAGHPVAVAQVHHPHALRRAAHPGDAIGLLPDDGAVLGDQHHLEAVPDDHRAGQPAARLVVADSQHAHRAAALGRVLVDAGALAEAVLGHHQQVLVVARDLDGDHLVALAQLHPRHAGGVAAHRAARRPRRSARPSRCATPAARRPRRRSAGRPPARRPRGS